MHIHFTINYQTQWGQYLLLTGALPELGNMDEANGLRMFPKDPEQGTWDLLVELKPRKQLNFAYKFVVVDENTGLKTYEWGDRRLTISPEGFDTIEVNNTWRSSADPGNALYSSAFTNGLMRPSKIWPVRNSLPKTLAKDEVRVRFQINVARIKPRQRVGITGNTKALGNWDTQKALLMSNKNHPQWMADAVFKKTNFPLKYKYFIYDEASGKPEFLEAAEDRVLESNGSAQSKNYLVRTDEQFVFPRYPWKGAGVAIPVFSLRRKNGFGVGEFSDIKLLVDWAKRTRMKMIQILPVNDTIATQTWTDSYPYAAISVFALHPIYANLLKMGDLSSKLTRQIVEERGRILDEEPNVDYEGVMQLKSRFFKMLYEEQKKDFLKDPEFQEFFERNKDWLKPYAAFSYLRDLFNTPNFNTWGPYSTYSPKLVEALTNPEAAHYDDIAVHYFIQFHLHKQLKEAVAYARNSGIVLKGDIPIGIYRYSVDAWTNPKLYNLDKQAGAPPDDFSTKGQNWGFPTYNWQEMAKDNYQWWQKRLQKMAEYFDAFRIDHILGFFRIWEVPYSQVEGIMGYFNPSIAVTKEEMAARGMWFDYDRLCKPYIREHFLYERFGEMTGHAKGRFLDELSPGIYQLKPEFNTQRKVQEYLRPSPDTPYDERARLEKLKEGLFSLISEVLLLPDPDQDDTFYPRNSMHYTRSYQEIDDDMKHKLNELYIDYFYRRNEGYWRHEALVKLPAIKQATNMLICGEDLGMVPETVPEVMNELGLLSLEIQRMPKNPRMEFTHPASNPYLSVATPSSHDMPTIRGWWEENPARSQRFFNNILGNEGASPFFAEPWIVRQILDQHFYSPSMWAIFPIQDLVGADANLRHWNAKGERINNPANPTHYWRYRFHIPIEDLLREDAFNDMIAQLVEDSGRAEPY